MSQIISHIGLVISLAGFAVAINTLPSLVTWFSVRLDVPPSSFGLVFFFQYVSYLICSMIIGRLHALFKMPLLGIATGASLIISIFLFGLGSLISFNNLVIVMIVIGGAGGLVESIGTTLITDSSSSNRMLYLSQFFYALGAFVAPLLVGFLLQIHLLVSTIVQLIGLFSLSISLVVWILVFQPWNSSVSSRLKPTHSGVVEDSATAVKTTNRVDMSSKDVASSETKCFESKQIHSVVFILLFFTMITYVILESTVSSWLAVYMYIALGYSDAISSFSLSLFWIGLGLSRFIFIFVDVRQPAITLLGYMTIISFSIVALLVPFTLQNSMLLLPVVFLFGFGCGPIWPLLIEYCFRIYSQQHFTMYLVGAGSIGALIGPTMTSILFSMGGIENLITIAFIYLLVMVFTIILTVAITTLQNV